MKLTFLYQPVDDLAAAAAFHRDQLGWDEAWRESDDTIAFALPDGETQIMLSTSPMPAGPMYLVDDLTGWIRDHPGVELLVEPYEIPGGKVAGFSGPGGNTFYVFDMPEA